VSVATYLLPTLAGLAADKKYPEFREQVRQGVGYLLFVNLIAAILLTVLAEPIVRLLFERGHFTASSTQRATSALVYLGPGLVVFSLNNILARAFYALGDTKTPMKISVFCLMTNLILASGLVWNMKQSGLALANTLSGILNLALLLYGLRRKLKRLDFSPLRRDVLPMCAASGGAVAVAWTLGWWWEKSIGHENLLTRAGAVFVPALVAGVLYLAVAWWMKSPSARDVLALLNKRLA
jgi:putative peptidoglycan lipid II flippase